MILLMFFSYNDYTNILRKNRKFNVALKPIAVLEVDQAWLVGKNNKE